MRVGGCSDQPAHISCLWRQAAQPVPHKITEAVRDGNGPAAERRLLVLDERSRALERVKGVAAAGLVQLCERVPGQSDPQPRPQNLADRTQAQRAQLHMRQAIR